jgi:hypothetical protein
MPRHRHLGSTPKRFVFEESYVDCPLCGKERVPFDGSAMSRDSD